MDVRRVKINREYVRLPDLDFDKPENLPELDFSADLPDLFPENKGPSFVQGKDPSFYQKIKNQVSDLFAPPDPGLGPLSKEDFDAFKPVPVKRSQEPRKEGIIEGVIVPSIADVITLGTKMGAGLTKGLSLGTVDPVNGVVGIPFTNIKKEYAQPVGDALKNMGFKTELPGIDTDIAAAGAEFAGAVAPWAKVSKALSSLGAIKSVAVSGAVGTMGKTATKEVLKRIGTQAATGAIIGAADPRDKDESLAANTVTTAVLGAAFQAAGEGINALVKTAGIGKYNAYIKLKKDLTDILYARRPSPKVTKADAEKVADYVIKMKAREEGIKDVNELKAKEFRHARKTLKTAAESGAKMPGAEPSTEAPVKPAEVIKINDRVVARSKDGGMVEGVYVQTPEGAAAVIPKIVNGEAIAPDKAEPISAENFTQIEKDNSAGISLKEWEARQAAFQKEWAKRADENRRKLEEAKAQASATREEDGYTITQVKDAGIDAKTEWKIDLKDDYKLALNTVLDMVKTGQAGGRLKFGEGPETEWSAYGSTYPDFMKNRFSGAETANAIQKALNGETLGIRQADIVESAVEYINNEMYYNYRKDLENDGIDPAEIDRAEREAEKEFAREVEAQFAEAERRAIQQEGSGDAQAIIDEWGEFFTRIRTQIVQDSFSDEQSILPPEDKTFRLTPQSQREPKK
jgi:hypothetical protein